MPKSCTNVSEPISLPIYLAVEGASRDNGANILQQTAIVGLPHYEWCFIKHDDSYEIKNRFTRISMDATLSGGYNVLQWGYWGGDNQEWIIDFMGMVDPPTTSPTARPSLRPATAAPSTRVTAAPSARVTVAPSTRVTVAPSSRETVAPTTSPTAKPTPAPTGTPTAAPTFGMASDECAALPLDGKYQIINQKSKLPLAVQYSYLYSGANVHQGDAGHEANKNWMFVEVSDGYYNIINENSGLAVTGM